MKMYIIGFDLYIFNSSNEMSLKKIMTNDIFQNVKSSEKYLEKYEMA